MNNVYSQLTLIFLPLYIGAFAVSGDGRKPEWPGPVHHEILLAQSEIQPDEELIVEEEEDGDFLIEEEDAGLIDEEPEPASAEDAATGEKPEGEAGGAEAEESIGTEEITEMEIIEEDNVPDEAREEEGDTPANAEEEPAAEAPGEKIAEEIAEDTREAGAEEAVEEVVEEEISEGAAEEVAEDIGDELVPEETEPGVVVEGADDAGEDAAVDSLIETTDEDPAILDLLVEEGEDSIDTESAEVVSEEAGEEYIIDEEEGALVEDESESVETGKVAEDEIVASETEPAQKDTEAVAIAPARVEQARSINFARNLKDYRSPKLAMLMSLFIPGLGQAYSKKYWKTALFGAVEIGVIGASVAFYRRGLERDKDARRHADTYYSYSDFEEYYTKLREALQTYYTDEGEDLADSTLKNYYSFGYEPDSLKKDFNAKNKDFYAMIGEDEFIHGWEDCAPGINLIGEKLEKQAPAGDTVYVSADEDTVIVSSNATGLGDNDSVPFKLDRYVGGKSDVREDQKRYGFSNQYDKYKDIVNDKNDQFKVAVNIMYLMLVNHIASAIDAGISAKRHNNRLLGKQSLWERIDLKQQWVNTGNDKVIGCALGYRF
ncbi:MAG: hypothetical protein GF350_15780 [Chitinivibrionales bacterium]|nr:hypothetical protein [Chitinivibrionales bacterium]